MDLYIQSRIRLITGGGMEDSQKVAVHPSGKVSGKADSGMGWEGGRALFCGYAVSLLQEF
jgi:hypothetical protein